jgi:DNA-binding MarR family transcriptional regulator
MKQSPVATTAPPVDSENLDQPLSLAVLLETAHSIQNRFESMMEEVGLTPAKFQAIDALAEAGKPLTLGEFASRLKCVRSNVTQLVDRLEADGFAKRVNDSTDRRAVLAVVTPLGLERRAAGAKAVARLQNDLSARVAPAERAVLHRLMAALK